MKKLLACLIPFVLAACTAPADLASPAIPAATHPREATSPPDAVETSLPPIVPTPTSFVLPDFTPFPAADADVLVIDGFFADWDAYSPAGVDPEGDSGPSGVDFTQVYAAHTESHLLLLVDLGKTVNLQSEPALKLNIRSGDEEVSFDFGSRRGRIDGQSVSQADMGVVSLPTVTSDTFELSFLRDILPEGDLEIWVSDLGTDGDVTSFIYSWNNPAVETVPLLLDRPEGALRVVSWNVLRDNLFDRNLGPHYARVLQALQPDVILIQEVYIYSEKTALDRVNEWLGGEWFARQQGDLITVSRFPFIDGWREGNFNLRARIFPSMLEVNGIPLVVFNAHLSCCGRDQDRQDEVDSFIGFLRQVGLPEGTPYFLAGDLNLVGDAQQLATLLKGNIIDEEKFGPDFVPDWDGNGLADLVPRHTHSRFAVTWRDDDSSYTPGRLDFVIYTDSVLNVQGFVLDASEMPPDVLAAYGLQADDTTGSDHLPLVADIFIVGAP